MSTEVADQSGPAMKTPPVVSPSEWQAARQRLHVKEKDLTRARDALAAERADSGVMGHRVRRFWSAGSGGFGAVSWRVGVGASATAWLPGHLLRVVWLGSVPGRAVCGLIIAVLVSVVSCLSALWACRAAVLRAC